MPMLSMGLLARSTDLSTGDLHPTRISRVPPIAPAAMPACPDADLRAGKPALDRAEGAAMPFLSGSHDPQALARAGYERCHPADSFAALQRRARFSREDRGLLRQWLAIAVQQQAEGAGHDR